MYSEDDGRRHRIEYTRIECKNIISVLYQVVINN
jgi:hypothetical protein